MERKYIIPLSDSIVSPLGIGTAANLAAVRAGRSAIRRHEGRFDLPDPFMASLFDEEVLQRHCAEAGISPGEYTRFEQIAILSVKEALRDTDIRPEAADTLFLLSSTKGNVHLFEEGDFDPLRYNLGNTARRIARYFGNPNDAPAVSNACISGVAAQITAQRLLALGHYRTVITIGADRLSRFIISGFQSLKALSEERCCPFDAERTGLNLGEAAACIIFGTKTKEELHAEDHVLLRGAIRNDANHISGPSRTAEGSFNALSAVCDGIAPEDIAAISLHGTATAYNDAMESLALHRAGLSALPATSLKSIYGHTLGAAGLLETILTLHAVDAGIILPTPGFSRPGTPHPVNVSPVERSTAGGAVVKLMSGFGGVNAAVLYVRGADVTEGRYADSRIREEAIPTAIAEVRLSATGPLCTPTGERDYEEQGRERLRAVYDTCVGGYPRFFKMDFHSQAGFLCSEILAPYDRPDDRPDTGRAVCAVSFGGCYLADRAYEETIHPGAGYFPSPAAFVYTLANVVTAEAAIRRHLQGETSSFVLSEHNPDLIRQLTDTLYADPQTETATLLLLDAMSETAYSATGRLLSVTETGR